MVVTVGVAVTLTPVDAERLAEETAGAYVAAPLAVRLVEEPIHIAVPEPPFVVGVGLTLTCTVAVPPHSSVTV